MTIDFRRVEAALAEFFRQRGIAPTSANGEVYLGTCSTHPEDDIEHQQMSRCHAAVDANPETTVVSLSDLARELARDL